MSDKNYLTGNENDARFAELDEVLNDALPSDFRQVKGKKGGIPIHYDGKQAYVLPSEQAVLCIGGTGSCKTRRMIMPYILSCIGAEESLVMNDPKGELYRYFHDVLVEKGYNIHVLDYQDPSCGDRMNVLQYGEKCYREGKTDRAADLFDSLGKTLMSEVRSDKDPYWTQNTAMYISGLAALACDTLEPGQVTFQNLCKIHSQGEKSFSDGESYMNAFLKNRDSKTYKTLIEGCSKAPNETRASLYSVLTSVLGKFVRSEGIIDQGSDSSFEVEELVKHKTALFIMPRDESGSHATIISAVINQIYEILTDIAHKSPGERLKRRVNLVIEEFATMTIPDMSGKVSLSRSRNIGWVMACQSYKQLEQKYGEGAQIILENSNIVFFHSNNMKLLSMLSDLCGSYSDDEFERKVPLLSADRLRHLDKDKGQILFLLSRMHPYLGQIPDISEFGLTPLKKVKIPKRVLQIPDEIHFDSLCENEKSRHSYKEMEKRQKAMYEERKRMEELREAEQKIRALIEKPEDTASDNEEDPFGILNDLAEEMTAS